MCQIKFPWYVNNFEHCFIRLSRQIIGKRVLIIKRIFPQFTKVFNLKLTIYCSTTTPPLPTTPCHGQKLTVLCVQQRCLCKGRSYSETRLSSLMIVFSVTWSLLLAGVTKEGQFSLSQTGSCKLKIFCSWPQNTRPNLPTFGFEDLNRPFRLR